MATVKPSYPATGTALTCTIASLTNNSQRQSTAVDNTSNLYEDVTVQLVTKTASSATSATGVVNVYVLTSSDGGTTYGENAGASDAAITLTAPPNAFLLFSLNTVANSTTYKSDAYSIKQALGFMPDHWVLVVENKSGATLDATGGNHSLKYAGLNTTIA